MIGAVPRAYPTDWPDVGPIDLARHDPPHASSTLEWWYVNCHLTAIDGRPLSLFASFFRTALGEDDTTGETVHAHALTWALVDPTASRYVAESLVDKDAPAIALARLDRGEGIKDPLIRNAVREVVARGAVPLPDALLARPASVALDELRLDYDGRCFEKLADGSYRLTLRHRDQSVAAELTFALERPIYRHGADGVVHGKSAEAMFYYFSPRCRVEGVVELDGRVLPVEGQGWYDHEFGRPAEGSSPVLESVSWDWISAMLDDGSDLSIYCLIDDRTGAALGRYAILVGPDDVARRFEDDAFSFVAGGSWTSTKTFVRYPTTWTIEIPAASLHLEVEAALEAQEMITNISKPSFWEGRVRLAGTVDGQPAVGVGFVERSGLESVETVDEFFGAVGRETRRSVRTLLPLELDRTSAARVVAGEHNPRYLEGVDLQQLSRTVVAPIRAIVDRGGKAWRSYVALACCDAVGGDSQPLKDWLALPELVHVGSLMVDDVQDRSTVRRGGPAAHLLYGEALAINAGGVCYFLPYLFMEKADLPAERRLRLYDLYFEAVRAAHAGQALDIDGLRDEMPALVESGNGAAAERRVLAVHRLKSGVPASCLARMGAVLGNGTDAQVDALGRFVEDIGVAFQIVDDLLNLEGFERDLKSQAEDVAEGKVTMPIAKALSLASPSERRRLWDILAARSGEPAALAEAVDIARRCGALAACRRDAEQMIERGWTQLDPEIPDSLAKVMLRVFSWRVLDRTY